MKVPNKALFIILAVIFYIMAAVGLVFLLDKPTPKDELSSLEDIATGDLEDGEVYLASDFILYDQYAVETSDGRTTNYYLISFEDKNNDLVMASLIINSSDSCYRQMQDYMNDIDAYALDMGGYLKITDTVTGDLYSYFRDGCSMVIKNGIRYDKTTSYVFDYVCGVDEDPAEELYDPVAGIIMIVAGAALGTLMLFLGKRAAKKAAEASANIQPPIDYSSVYGGQPQQPAYPGQQPYQQPTYPGQQTAYPGQQPTYPGQRTNEPQQ